WTSQLFVSDWWQPVPIPVSVSVTQKGQGNYEVVVDNQTNQRLTHPRVVVRNQVFTVADVGPNQSKTNLINMGSGTQLRDFVSNYGQQFANAVQSRQHAFGGRESGQLSDLPNSTMAASFLSQMGRQDTYMNNFISPPGLDMT